MGLDTLYNGIPLYDWLMLIGMLLGLAGALLVAVGRKPPPARYTASAGNPNRKRGYMR